MKRLKPDDVGSEVFVSAANFFFSFTRSAHLGIGSEMPRKDCEVTEVLLHLRQRIEHLNEPPNSLVMILEGEFVRRRWRGSETLKKRGNGSRAREGTGSGQK